MKQFLQLVGIGIAGGAVLAIIMQVIYSLTGNQANNMLYNVDYFPVIHVLNDTAWFGMVFHLVFCIVSVFGLFYVLKFIGWHYKMWPYIVVYTAGSGVLYFLTLLTDEPPAANDFMAWFYWTASHLVFSIVVAFMIIRYVGRAEKDRTTKSASVSD